jgi:hypothetical protein
MRKLFLIALAATVLGLASTATAARPNIFQVDITVPDSTCPGINLMFHLQGGEVQITQNPTKEILTAPNFVVSWSANGKTLSSRGPAVLMTTFNADGSIAQSKVTGLLVAVHIPGQGVIALQAGYLIVAGAFNGSASQVVLSHGPNDFFSEGGLTAFCAYFADP